ncbi:hypothetical protein JHU04_004653, partial [Brenneria sp. 4F2]|nr:hypothetical protein [Brenneria bubanii]
VKQLQEEVDLLKASGKEEKQRFIELNEEYQALERLNSQAKTKVNFLESQLADTSEKDAWLSKMHQLESLGTKETQEKY